MKNSTIIIIILLASFLTSRVIGSAIPMWEFLSREEKMSRLYRLFSQQAIQFCADLSKADCSKNLLTTGVRNLAIMDNNILDKLDPYQRGAKDMIWRALTGTSKFTSRTSENIEGTFTTSRLSMENGDSETNSIIEESVSTKDYLRVGPYYIGPMVTRVYPDGRPVPEDHMKIRLLKDEDIDEFKYTILPSIADVEANFDKSSYRNKVANYDRRGMPGRLDGFNKQKERYDDSLRYNIRLRRISLDSRNVGCH